LIFLIFLIVSLKFYLINSFLDKNKISPLNSIQFKVKKTIKNKEPKNLIH